MFPRRAVYGISVLESVLGLPGAASSVMAATRSALGAWVHAGNAYSPMPSQTDATINRMPGLSFTRPNMNVAKSDGPYG